MIPLIAIINTAAGPGRAPDFVKEVRTALQAHGIDAKVIAVRDGDETRAAAEAAIATKPGLVIVGGGDGTVSTVAAMLAGSSTALGILPLGTRNHFARDLQLPLDLASAAQVIAANHVVTVDMGEVNGRSFVNNSSIGLYPHMVLDRVQQQHRRGRRKWLAMLVAILATFRRFPIVRARLTVDGQPHERTTPFVMVGNNEYQLEGAGLGRRRGLDGGHLSIYLAPRVGRWRLIVLALRALVGRLHQANDFEALQAEELVIDAPYHRLPVAVVGEISLLTAPLRSQLRPAALRVIVAAAGRVA